MKGPWRRNVFLYILVLLPKANKKGWERTYCLICWKGFLQRAFIIERANSIRIILHFYFKISNLTFDLPVSYGGSRLFKFWLLSSSLLVIFFGQIFFFAIEFGLTYWCLFKKSRFYNETLSLLLVAITCHVKSFATAFFPFHSFSFLLLYLDGLTKVFWMICYPDRETKIRIIHW